MRMAECENDGGGQIIMATGCGAEGERERAAKMAKLPSVARATQVVAATRGGGCTGSKR